MLRSIFGPSGVRHNRNASRRPHFEMLEIRQLLSVASYSAASYANTTWQIVGQDFSGWFSLGTGSGSSVTVTGGEITRDGQTTVIDISSSTFSFSQSLMTLTYAVPSINPNRFELNMRLSSSEDHATGGNYDSLGQAVLVKQTDHLFKTDSSSEAIGTWSLTGVNTSGSFTVGYKTVLGVETITLTAASLKINNKAIALNLAQSSISLDVNTGETVITFRDKAGTALITYRGYLADNGDIIGLKSDTVASGNTKDLVVALKLGASNTYSGSDFAVSSLWTLAGNEANGRFEISGVDSKGVATISGSSLRLSLGTDIDGTTQRYATNVNAKGTLTIDKNGNVTMKLTINPNTMSAVTLTLTGKMNATKNTISLLSSDGSIFMILTTNADHAATLNNANKTVVVDRVVGGQGLNLTYENLTQKYAGLNDLDGNEELSGSVSVKVATGTLVYTIGATTYTRTSADGYFTLTSSATNIYYYTDSTVAVKGSTVGLYVAMTTNPVDSAAARLAFTRVANPVSASVTKNKNVATQPSTNGGTDGTYGEFRFTRSSTTGTLNINVTLSGAGVYGLDYVVQDSEGNTISQNLDDTFTVSFVNGSNAALLRIVPLFQDPSTTGTGDRTVTATVVTPTFKDGYEYSASNTATLTIKGKFVTGATSVTVGVDKNFGTIVQDAANNYTILTISRPNTTNGAFTVNYTLEGIDGRYEQLQYSVDNGKTWLALTGNSINFSATDKAIKVKITLVNDSAHVLADVKAIFTISIASGDRGLFYINSQSSTATVTVKDNNPSVSIRVANASEAGETTGYFRINRNGSTVNPLTVTFSFDSSSTAIEGVDYTLTLPAGSSYNSGTGVYTIVIPSGATYVDVQIKAIADNIFVEANKLLILNVNTGPYVRATNSATVTIINNAKNTAPTAAGIGTVGPTIGIKIGEASALTLTGQDLINALNATDIEDAPAATVDLALTAITAGVSITINSTTYTSASVLTNVVIDALDTVVIGLANTVSVNNALTLFRVQARDSQGALSNVKGGAQIRAKTVTNFIPTLEQTQTPTAIHDTVNNLYTVDLSDPLSDFIDFGDLDLGQTLTLTITAPTTGTLTVNSIVLAAGASRTIDLTADALSWSIADTVLAPGASTTAFKLSGTDGVILTPVILNFVVNIPSA